MGANPERCVLQYILLMLLYFVNLIGAVVFFQLVQGVYDLRWN